MDIKLIFQINLQTTSFCFKLMRFSSVWSTLYFSCQQLTCLLFSKQLFQNIYLFIAGGDFGWTNVRVEKISQNMTLFFKTKQSNFYATFYDKVVFSQLDIFVLFSVYVHSDKPRKSAAEKIVDNSCNYTVLDFYHPIIKETKERNVH